MNASGEPRMDLEKLRELEAAATPGRWKVRTAATRSHGAEIASVEFDIGIVRPDDGELIEPANPKADAAFIVAAVEYVRRELDAAASPEAGEGLVDAITDEVGHAVLTFTSPGAVDSRGHNRTEDGEPHGDCYKCRRVRDVIRHAVLTGNTLPPLAAPILSQPETLDAAWKEAEAALPEGWWIASVRTTDSKRWTARAENSLNDPLQVERGEGPTPAAALQALATRLKEHTDG